VNCRSVGVRKCHVATMDDHGQIFWGNRRSLTLILSRLSVRMGYIKPDTLSYVTHHSTLTSAKGHLRVRQVSQFFAIFHHDRKSMTVTLLDTGRNPS
jgi:hypothetical protein